MKPKLSSTSFASSRDVVGHTTPRMYTWPLVEGPPGPCGCGCALDETTSYGFKVERFAEKVLRLPLDPWQRWLVIHGGELLPDGRPRFRHLLILVARQNGKTHLLMVLTLYWMFVERHKLTLGTSTNLMYAEESWQDAIEKAKATKALAKLLPKGPRQGVTTASGRQQFRTAEGCRYKIAASNRRGGRSLRIDRLVQDELREHQDWSAYKAAVPAMSARPHAQNWMISNAGDDTSVVLNDKQKSALTFIKTGVGDYRLGLFEWSALPGTDIWDVEAWAMANPSLNIRRDFDDLAGEAAQAADKGGDVEAMFRTEYLCQHVPKLDAGIDPQAWADGFVEGHLIGMSNIVACVEVSASGHVTLVGAAVMPDGRTRVRTIGAWDTVADARKSLSGTLTAASVRRLGWLPVGPTAVMAADLKDRTKQGRYGWPPRGIKVEEIRGEVSAVCMGLAEQVESGGVVHSNDPLLNDHVLGVAKKWIGPVWVFDRDEDRDAAYAVAGAVHLARTMPTPIGKPRILG